MNCFLLNECRHQNRCCNFCKVKCCSDRCTDDYTKCRYFENALFNEANNGFNSAKKGKW